MGRRSRWRGLLNILMLAVSLPAALARQVFRLRIADPIDRAARASLPPCSSPPFIEFIREFRVFSKRETPRGTLAFYTGACVSIFGGRDRFYGYALVADGRRVARWGWHRVGPAIWQVEGLAELRTVSGCTGGACDASVYGLVSSAVDTVEAAFLGGQTHRTKATDGAFALTAVGTEGIFELRLLGGDGSLLGLTVPPKLLRDYGNGIRSAS